MVQSLTSDVAVAAVMRCRILAQSYLKFVNAVLTRQSLYQ